ncbi:8629_t:CDS:2, partial [Gigaspora rosea]
IDDRPANDVITEFARNNINKSRDQGNGDFSISGQSFTLQSQLPSISYILNCNDKISKILCEWQVPINDKSNIVWQYNSPYINGNSVGKANLIFDAFIARFYILQDFGVVLISTESSDDALKYPYLSDLTSGFELLATIAFRNQTAIYGGTLELSTPAKLPWTEKDIIILTNRICESSCALLTQRLAEINVPIISDG